MKLFLTLISLAAFAVSVVAQQDPKAKEVLDHLSEATQAQGTIKAVFTSNVLNSDAGMDEEYNGILWQKGDKYKLDFMDAITYFDGEKKWVYMPDVQEVNLFSVDETMTAGSVFDNPQKIFTIYEEGFKYLYKGKTEFQGEQLITIELVPEDTDVEYFKIKLYLNDTKDEIKGFKYFVKDGTRVTVKINEYKTGVPMDDAMFVFDKSAHPDAELIDMRE